MAYSAIQQGQGVGAASATQIETDETFTVLDGDTIIVRIFHGGTATCTAGDEGGENEYPEVTGSPINGGFSVRFRLFVCQNAKAFTGKIGAIFGSAVVNRLVHVAQYRGVGAYIDAKLNFQATPGTSANGVTSGNINFTLQPALLDGFSFQSDGSGSAPAAGTGFTSPGTVWNGGGGNLARWEHRRVTSTGNAAATFTAASNVQHFTSAVAFLEALTPATLSSPTPSGTIASVSVARLGASTDQTSGTLYAVIDTSGNLSGVTASQIKAGNKSNNTTALSSGSRAVSGSSPWVTLTGLTPGTTYAYALVQTNDNGDSNVVTGTFTTHATGADGLFPTAVSSNGRWIEDQNGDPWPVIGDSNIAAHHAPHEDVEDYLDELVAHGFNAFWFKVGVVSPESLGEYALDPDGNSPFVGTQFQSDLNPAYWDNMEWVVQQAAERGLTCFIYPTWAGFNDDEGDRVAMEAASGGQMQAYGVAVGERFRRYPNIIWMNGGDRPSPGATLVSRWGSVATGIQSTGDAHLWGLHGTRGVSKTDYISTAGMGSQPLDLCTMYQDENDPVGDAADEYADDIGPLIALEMRYENENSVTFNRLRLQYWGTFCAGGVGHVFGNRPRWHMDLVDDFKVSGVTLASTWNDPTGDDDRGTDDFSMFSAFLDDIGGAWATMGPDTTDTFLTSGEGTGTTRVAAKFNSSATSGPLAVAYRPHGGSATLTFDLTELAAATIKVSKYDPVSGAYTEIGTYANTGSQSIGSLGNNSAGDSDWVLLFEASDAAQETGDYTEVSSLGAAFSAVATASGMVSAGVNVGATQSATAAAVASITAGVGAGDADTAARQLLASVAAQVSVDEQYAAIAQAVSAIQAGLEAGEEWAAIAAAEAGITAGIDAGAAFVFESQSAQVAALIAGTQAAADFLGAVSAFAMLSAGVSAGDAFSASARVSRSISAGVSAGASVLTTTADDGLWTAAASVQAEFQSVSASVASLAGASVIGDAYGAICMALASLTAGVILGATFSAASSADVSIIGAVASVRAIRRMSATVTPIRPTATLN